MKSVNGNDSMITIDELDRISVECDLATDLRRAEERADFEGWIEADIFDKEMGIID